LALAQQAGINSTYLYQVSKNIYYPDFCQFTRLPNFCPWPSHQKFCCSAVCHGDEIPFVFRDTGAPYPWNMTRTTSIFLELTFTEKDLEVSGAMLNYWTSFARYGDPNKAGGAPTWPVYRSATDISMDLGYPIKQVTGLNAKNCDFWDTVGYYHAEHVRKFLKV
jgi:carboxylesterase type B